jgi:hypothetical protein
VIGTFVRLAAWSFKNRALARVRRLRQPRYLVALVLGAAYFYGMVFRNQLQAARSGQHFLRPETIATWGPDIAVAGSVVLWIAAMAAWVFSSGHAWRFTGAEVQFLYTAPVSRRHLLHYKLLRGQVGALFGVLVAAFFSGALLAGPVVRWAFLLGGWLLFGTLGLHMSGIALAKTRLSSAESRRTWEAWVPPAVLTILSIAIVVDLAARITALPPGSFHGTAQPAFDIARSGVAGLALWPFRALVTPLVSPTARDLVVALVPVVGLAALTYAWVLRGDTAAAGATRAVEQRQAATATRRFAPVVRAQPFVLGPTGRPEVAIAWKNLILLSRYASLRTLAGVLPPLVAVVAMGAYHASSLVVAVVAIIIGGYAILLGPMSFRNDLRHDLPRLAVLRTWPVHGVSLVAGELAAPALVLTAIAWSAIVMALAGSVAARGELGDWPVRIVAALSAAVLVPTLIVGQLVVQNAAVILLPGWITTGEERSHGIEAAGQNMLVLAGTLLAFSLGLVPAAIVGGLLGWICYLLVGIAGLVPAAVATSAVLGAEIGVAVWLLGRVLDRTEPAHVESRR